MHGVVDEVFRYEHELMCDNRCATEQSTGVISCCDSQLREPNLDQVTPVTQDLQYLIRAYIKKMATAGLLKAEESFPHLEKPGR